MHASARESLPAAHGLTAEAVRLPTILGGMVFPDACQIVTPWVRDHGNWEPEETTVMQSLIRPGAVVVDIGAHVGWHTVLAARCAGPTGRVFAFEPDPRNYAMLVRNLELTGSSNVEPINAGAWSEEGEGVLSLAEVNSGDNRSFEFSDGDHHLQVPMRKVTVDSVVGDLRVDIVKLDVQGVERAAVQGMEALIERWHPTMLVEFDPPGTLAAGGDPAEVIRYYRSLGYALRVMGKPDIGDDATEEQLVELAYTYPGDYFTLILTGGASEAPPVHAAPAPEPMSANLETLQRRQAEDIGRVLQIIDDQGATVERMFEQVQEEMRSHVDARLRRFAPAADGALAVPYTAGAPFGPLEHPGAGPVYGFSGDGSDGDGALRRRFADIFRGPEDRVRQSQARYVALLEERTPVVDLGCGRGEFLDLLQARGVAYTGVEADEAMVALCQAKGHESLVHADALAYLEGVEDDSLGAIFAFQMVEHLGPAELRKLFELALRKLQPGGLLAAETINPHRPSALKCFWVDPTRRHPIFPEAALALLLETGFDTGFLYFPTGTGAFERDRLDGDVYAAVGVKAR